MIPYLGGLAVCGLLWLGATAAERATRRRSCLADELARIERRHAPALAPERHLSHHLAVAVVVMATTITCAGVAGGATARVVAHSHHRSCP